MASLSTLFSLILVLSSSGVFYTAQSKTFWGDIQVLKQLKYALQNASVTPGSCLSSWDFTLDPCDNLFSEKFTCGFRCDVVVSGSSRLTELTLDQAGYAGSLASSSTWNLPYLETLDVSNNYFSGQIPESLSNLTRLRRLALSGNSFTGEIPSSIGSLSNLEELYLDNNNLEGPIPSSLNKLKRLKRLEIQINNLNGHIPTDLGSLTDLYYLDISDNAITGGIPASLPNSLVELSARNNSLSGFLTSESFRDLMYLQVLDLSYNKLTGSVPIVLFEIPSLEQLSLSFNELSSMEIPASSSSYNLGSESGLIAVDLSNNGIEGLLPSFMGMMPKLTSLSLENNKFTGMIPTQYALKTVFPEEDVSAFERLLLGGNYLIGGIPSPLLVLKEGSANVRLGDNCLYRCPLRKRKRSDRFCACVVCLTYERWKHVRFHVWRSSILIWNNSQMLLNQRLSLPLLSVP
ncbi:putative LRR receptor-like serine/threonine-protein kinase [Senna tora]|uniref:Putative LRR receptor-like serine/threonine-protein kinase n=1 Tax=Senna tora TaxID=362788 RepID=A0A834W4S9_9FABA|nr:putative LRR receptor-like serine/threonine-protein kinase [Senna tora]